MSSRAGAVLRYIDDVDELVAWSAVVAAMPAKPRRGLEELACCAAHSNYMVAAMRVLTSNPAIVTKLGDDTAAALRMLVT